MVRAGLGGRWKCQFANDFDALKVQVYADNWGEAEILEDDIHKVKAEDLGRRVDLAWASFPCQDLSAAGNGLGIGQASGANRTRSGTFWTFVDLMKSLKANGRLPRIVVLENVVGLLTINGGEEFKAVIAALVRLGMRAGAVVVDARHFVPQSRQRVFIVAVSKTTKVIADDHRAVVAEPLHLGLAIGDARAARHCFVPSTKRVGFVPSFGRCGDGSMP